MGSTLKKYRFAVVAAALVFAFLFSRFYGIDRSFEFYNDIGRDNLVMLNWYRTGKPPLLGPQTSVMPFNQSALYFYVLYPMFLMMKMSLYNTLVTCALLYVAGFLAGAYVFRKNKVMLSMLFIVAFLTIMYPQAILQQRFVWNPSFLLLFLSFAVFSYLSLVRRYTWRRVAGVSIGMALAFSFNYSAILAILPLLILSVFQLKKKSLFVFLGFGFAMLLVNLPTAVFELRHDFLLTRQMFVRGTERQKSLGLEEKTEDFLTMVFSLKTKQENVLMSVLVAGAIGWGLLEKQKEKRMLRTLAAMLGLSVAIAVAAPFDLQPHYIFGIATLLFFVIAALPKKQMVLSLIVFSWFWLSPSIVLPYFGPAYRTVTELEVCAAKVCGKERAPMFVSLEAFYQFHAGPEWRFLLKKAGCNIRDIETEPTTANSMAVVVDNSLYEHGKTAYHELTLFGPSILERSYACDGDIQVHVISREQ